MTQLIEMRSPIGKTWRWVLSVVLVYLLVDTVMFPLLERNVMSLLAPENMLQVGFKFIITTLFLVCVLKSGSRWADHLLLFIIMLVLGCWFMFGNFQSVISLFVLPVISLIVLFRHYSRPLAFTVLCFSLLFTVYSYLGRASEYYSNLYFNGVFPWVNEHFPNLNGYWFN